MANYTNLATSIDPIEDLTINLRKLMAEKNITEANLARQTSIPQPTLHKILSGKTGDPRASTLKLLADFFDVTIDMLITGGIPAPSSGASNIIQTQSIAIISWSDCLHADALLKTLDSMNWPHWITTEYSSGKAYALTSKPSMEPRFPKGSTLIIDPNISPEDGDLIVVHFPNTNEATLRELAVDGPVKQLIPICRNSPAEDIRPKIKELGVLVKSIFKFH